jgi:hypothetical protein
MATKLEKRLKRELEIDGKLYTLTLDARGFKLVPKGRRNGQAIAWKAFVEGEAALAVALSASLAQGSV